jgi:hypothetical protein
LPDVDVSTKSLISVTELAVLISDYVTMLLLLILIGIKAVKSEDLVCFTVFFITTACLIHSSHSNENDVWKNWAKLSLRLIISVGSVEIVTML